MMKKPVLLQYNKLTVILDNNIEEIKQKLYVIKEDSSLKAPIFLYSYAMFEGAITTLMTKFCHAFPHKMAKEFFSNIEKTDIIDYPSNRQAIDKAAEKFVMKLTYGKTEEWLKQINEILGISIHFNHQVLTEIAETRNCLTHNNGVINRKYKINSGNMARGEVGKKLSLSESYVKKSILFLKEILETIKKEVSQKYKQYDKEYLIKSTWMYLFDSPLLAFEQVCDLKDDSFQIKREYLNSIFDSLSSSEQLLISVFVQQFSPSMTRDFLKKYELPMLAHITEKEKLYFMLELFDEYPLLLQN